MCCFFLSACNLSVEPKTSNKLIKPEFAKHFGFSQNKDSLFILHENNEVLKRIARPKFNESIACFATTQAAAFEVLGVANKVKACAFASYITDGVLKKNFEENSLINLPTFDNADAEWLAESGFDLIFYNWPSKELAIDNLQIPTLEYLENSPLARAEWIKVFAWFVNQDDFADSLFNSVKANYLNQLVKPKRPLSAFSGTFFQGNWYIAGKESYMASLIRDLGFSYHFTELLGNSSTRVEPEFVFTSVNDNTYWFTTFSGFDAQLSVAQNLINQEKNLQYFKPVINNKVVLINTNEMDFFGKMTFFPDELLKNLKIKLDSLAVK